MNKKAIKNKADALALDRKVVAGVDKHFANVQKLTIAGVDFTPAALKAVFQADIDAQNALDAGRAQAKELTLTQREARTKMRATRNALRTYLLGNYGEGAVGMLDDFGLTPPKKAVKTVAVKAEAIAKSKATRTGHPAEGSHATAASTSTPQK